MLKKIQNVWSFILKKKKLTNITNMYSLKNNFLFSNAVSSSLIFFVNSTNSLTLKGLKIIDKTQFFINYYRIFFIFLLFIIISIIFFVFFVM